MFKYFSTDSVLGVNLSEVVTELISTDWSDDVEMMVSETFDANAELVKHFPHFQVSNKVIYLIF